MSKPTKDITVEITEYTGHVEAPTHSAMSKKEHDHLIDSYKKTQPKADNKAAKEAQNKAAEAYVKKIKDTEDKVSATQHVDLPKSWDGKVTFGKADGQLYKDEFCANGGDDKTLKLFDRDKDGFVEKEEIAAVLHAIDNKNHARFEKLVGKGSVSLSSVISTAKDLHISEKDLGKMSPNYTLNVKTKSTANDITFID